MKKTLLSVGGCLLGLLLITAEVSAQEIFQQPASGFSFITKEIHSMRSQWLNMLPVEELSDYGFSSMEEFNLAEPGPAIEIYAMYATIDGKTEVQPTGEFFVPLMQNGESRVFLKIAFFEDRYQVVSIGESTLAQDASLFISKADPKAEERIIWIQHRNFGIDFIAAVPLKGLSENVLLTPVFTANRDGFLKPVYFKAMLERVSAMPVSFDY